MVYLPSFVPAWILRNVVRKNTPLALQLQLKLLEIPIQRDLGEYERLVKRVIDEKQLIRWYIAKIDSQKALIEAVYDDSVGLDSSLNPALH
eukprot:gene30115-36380_t